MCATLPKTLSFAAATLTLFSLASCSDDPAEMPAAPTEEAAVVVKLPDFNAKSSEQARVELFHFSGEVLKGCQTIMLPQSGAISFSRGENNKVYALSGISLSAEPGVTLEEAIAYATITSDASGAPMFYTAVSELDDNARDLTLNFARGIGRIDIANLDEGFILKTVKAENAPAVSFVFPVEGSVAGNAVVSYSRTYADGLEGIEKGVFTLFESAAPVDVTLEGIYAGMDVTLTASTPAIARNKVYTITVSNVATGATPAVSVTPWGDNETIGAAPDATRSLSLDMAASVLPASVTYDPATLTLTLPASGVESMKLAFSSDVRVDIDTVLFSGARVEKDSLPQWAFAKSAPAVGLRGDEVITGYDVTVAPQLIGRPVYEVRLGLRKASLSSVYDYLTLRVEAHPQQIETVHIGGHDWMCYNATSQSLDDQIYTTPGSSVQKMYDSRFEDCVGNYFQYGRPNPFSPWTSNDPAQFAEQQRNIPWASPDMMPLPEGYHVASFAEWKDLIPNNTLLPAAWTSPSGDSIKADVITLDGNLVTPSTATNAKKYLKRYVRFESVTTGAVLIVPFVGIKTNSTAEVPTQNGFRFDTRSAYWMADDRYCQLFDYRNPDGAQVGQNRWNYDGFMAVRGIKD